MGNSKIDRINSLEREVEDFHPVLRVLLPRLPGVTGVEYTHGSAEMGADFVVTRRDETLDDVSYVGLIVKTGKIKQDHADITRQIEECEIERIIQGKKRIILSEIWIVVNENITAQAKEKIHHKYKNKNIVFIDGEKVVNLIDKHYSEYWTDVSVEIGEYLRDVSKKAGVISEGSDLVSSNSEKIYVAPDLLKLEPSEKHKSFDKSKEKRVNIDQAIKDSKFLFIEAVMGSGKSTLLAKVAQKYSTGEHFNSSKIIPFICTANDFNENYEGDVENLILEVEKNIISYRDEKQYLVIIDAVDELKMEPEGRIDFIEKIYESANKIDNVSLIISSRTIDNPETEKIIDSRFDRYQICSFTVKQVISIIDKICESSAIKSKLLKDLEKSHLFKVLPKTPISAILLGKLLSENTKEIPSTMTELYSKYMELVMGRWDMSKGIQSQMEYDVIFNVSINIAIYLIDNSLYKIAASEARDIFDEYFNSRNLNLKNDLVFEKNDK